MSQELHDLVTSLEEKFGSGDGEVKKGAETQIMKKAPRGGIGHIH